MKIVMRIITMLSAFTALIGIGCLDSQNNGFAFAMMFGGILVSLLTYPLYWRKHVRY